MITNDIIAPSLDLPKEQIERLLDSLDEAAEDSDKKYPKRPHRTAFRARNVIVTVFDRLHMPQDIFTVCTRNLSLGGLAFLHDRNLEAETRLRMDIPTTHGERIRLYSRVAHCRLVGGTVYEVGVQFLSIVDDDKISTYAARLNNQNRNKSRMAS